MRGLVPPDTNDDTDVSRYVFVGQTPDQVALDLQADILAELPDYENIRFVDDPEEAIDADPPRPVKNEGVYVEFRDPPTSGSPIVVDVLRYVDEDDRERVRVELDERGGTWVVVRSSPAS